jgi:hypothetical protein
MSSLTSELDRVLRKVDSETAVLLQRAVRDALALAERRAKDTEARDAFGYPAGYFEATAGSFVNEPLERPVELPIETRELW